MKYFSVLVLSVIFSLKVFCVDTAGTENAGDQNKGDAHQTASDSALTANSDVNDKDSNSEKGKTNPELEETFFMRLNRMEIPDKFKLPEIVVGNENAPKTLIVYFSLTCPHCRDFHMNTYPQFKKEYVDSGKVKVIFRNYIDDQGAYESAQIIRCFCKDNVEEYSLLSEIVLEKQHEWLSSRDPASFLVQIFVNEGKSEEDVRACLKRADIGAGLMLEQKRAMRDLQLISMPSFLIEGGERHVGAISYDELVELCEKPLKKEENKAKAKDNKAGNNSAIISADD